MCDARQVLRPPRWVAVAVAVAALGFVVIATRSGRLATVWTAGTASATAADAATATHPASATPTPSPAARKAPVPLPLQIIAVAVLIWIVTLIVYWLILLPAGRYRPRFRPGRRRLEARTVAPAAAVDRAGAHLAAAAAAGLQALDEGEPGNAVVASWLRLERAAADVGVRRRPAETSAELAARVLADQPVSPAAIDRLAELYREARYSDHVLDETARAEARAALDQIRRELVGSAPRPPWRRPVQAAGR